MRKMFCFTGLSMVVLSICLLFDNCHGGCPHGRERCEWMPWENWSSCSMSCRGGYQSRNRLLCCKKGIGGEACLRECGLENDASESQSCNEICFNGGTYNSHRCNCTDDYYSTCCEKECESITNCEHRSCTNSRDVMCTRCEGVEGVGPGESAYVLSDNKKTCIKACSWRSDSTWCFPGTCAQEYAENCKCSAGFTGGNCMTMEEGPTILYSEFILNKGKTGEKSVPKDVSDWPVNNPSWTNVNNIKKMTYDFRSSYTPGYKSSSEVLNKHAFIKGYQVGITETTVDIKFYRGNVIQTKYSKRNSCGTVSATAPENVTLNCENILDVSTIIPSSLTTGDMLELTFDTSNGGFVEVEDKENWNSITQHFYNGHRNQSIIRLRFDFIDPYHCVEHGCTKETLNVPKIAYMSSPNISWDGWDDSTSGLDYYDIEVFELKYFRDKSGLNNNERISNGNTTDKVYRIQLPAKGIYSVELTAFDKAGNLKTTRRIVIYDKASSIETKINTKLIVTSALADHNWQWTTDSVTIEWIDHYMNKDHHNNHWLEEVVPQSSIDPIYDDQEKSRGVSKIDNVEGIVRFETSYRIDHDGGKNITSPAEFTSVGLNQSQMLTPSLVDGDTFRYWIKAYDIREEFMEENLTVHIDSSPPVLRNLWLTRQDRVNISVHNTDELRNMTIEWESYDEHSGLEEVSWRLFDNYTGNEILHGNIYHISLIPPKDNEECLSKYGDYSRGANCYCTSVVGCYHRHFQVKPTVKVTNYSHGGLFHNMSTGVHDSDYFLEVTVMNHAKHTTVLTKKITIDISPPHIGVVHDGLTGQPEVDFQDSLQLQAHWDGFFDKESGVIFYQYKFDYNCLLSADFGYDTEQKQITETYTTHATWTAPQPGRYHVTVVAYNRALEPSDPVCSDGVTVDISNPVLSELAVGSSHTTPGLVKTEIGSVWMIDSNRRRGQVIKPDTVCRQKATQTTPDHLLMFPIHISINGSVMTFSSSVCSNLNPYALLPIGKFYLSREHNLYVNWTSHDTESGIYDYQVGLMSQLTNEADPDMSPYTSTHHHPHYQNYHTGLSEGQQFYIAVKAINKAGLSTIKILGPGIVHTQASVFSSPISVTLENDFLTATWTDETFQEPAEVYLTYEVAVGSTVGGTDLLPYKPLEAGGGCDLSGTILCTSIPISSLHWSLHYRHTYYVSVKATNIVGLSTVGTSEPYIHSVRLPSPGVVLDISPQEEQELFYTSDLEDSDFQLKTSTLQVRWYGFDDGLPDVTYRTCIGSAPGLEDVRSFEDVGQNNSHLFRNLRLQMNKRYYVVVVEKTKAGETTISSDGVLILKRNEEIKTIYLHDSQRCDESTQHEVLFNTCKASSVYTSLYRAHWNMDDGVKTRYPDVYWSLEKKFLESDDLWHTTMDYELTEQTGKIIAGGLALEPGQTYRSKIKFCAGQVCSQPVYSSGITVIPHPPKSGTIGVSYTETESNAQITVTMTKFRDPDISSLEAYNVMRGYEWGITDNSHSSRLLTGWHTVDRIDTEEIDKISFTLQLPSHLTFTKCRRLAVRGFNKLGLYTVVSTDIQNCSAYDPKTIEPSVVIDAYGSYGNMGHGYGIHLDLNGEWPDVDMDYTPYKNVISAVWPSLRHHNYTWAVVSGDRVTSPPHYKRENIMAHSDPCSIPDVIKCGTTDNEYINIGFNSTEYLTHGRRYYVCIHADARDVEYEKWTTKLEEVNTCSDGITVDLSPPSPGKVVIQELMQGKYQASTTEVVVYWTGFTDVEEEGTSSHTSGISYYQVAIGSIPEGEDIQTFTDVGFVNHTVLPGLSLHDGNAVYVTVKATDFVNNSVSVSADPFIVDTTPPEISSSQIQVNGRYVTTSVISPCWNGVLVDNESGMKSYKVSLGSRPGYDDIVTSVSTTETCIMFDLTAKMKDGLSFYITLKGYNGIGQHTVTSSRKLIVDTTPPSAGIVYDGRQASKDNITRDKDFVTDKSEIGVYWEGFHDPHSSIKDFKVKVGTCPGCDDILKEYNLGAMMFVDLSAQNPKCVKGVRYFTTVTCCNYADLCVSVTSDGVVIDSSPPSPGAVSDGTYDMDLQYQASRTFLGCKWRGFQDPESHLNFYEWRMGTSPGGEDILTRRRVGLEGVVFSTLTTNDTLPVGQRIYCTVRAYNKAGLYSEVSSNGFIVDDTPPELLIAPRLDGHGSFLTNKLISRSVIKVKWEFKDDESYIEKQYVSISSHQLGDFDSSLLEVPGFLKEYAFTSLNLHDGSSYKVKVTACNMASLCATSKTEDILVDSTKPVTGTFAVETDHAAELTRHQSGWMTWTDTSLSLAWLGFADLHSGVDHYLVTVGSSAFATDLTETDKNMEGVVVYHDNQTGLAQDDEGFVQTHLIHTKNISEHHSVFVTIWAINKVGLESHPLHGELNLGSGGQLELVRRCGQYNCEGHCVCAAQDKTCSRRKGCNNIVSDVDTQQTGDDMREIDYTPSNTFLAAKWIPLEIHLPIRYEYSIGDSKSNKPNYIDDEAEQRVWFDAGTKTYALFALERGRELHQGRQYSFFVRAWYNSSSYSIFKSDGVTIDGRAPSITNKRGVAIKEHNDVYGGKDVDYQTFTDKMFISWKDKFTTGESGIKKYGLFISTTPEGHSIHESVELTQTSYTADGLDLEPSTIYYTSVTVYDRAGLVSWAYSDGVQVDLTSPHAGLVQDGSDLHDVDFQANASRISASWHGFSDNALVSYFWCVGGSNDTTDCSFANWKNVGLHTTSTTSVTSAIVSGTKLWSKVHAVDAVGHKSDVVVSDGVIIDTSPPQVVDVVYLGENLVQNPSFEDHTAYSSDNDTNCNISPTTFWESEVDSCIRIVRTDTPVAKHGLSVLLVSGTIKQTIGNVEKGGKYVITVHTGYPQSISHKHRSVEGFVSFGTSRFTFSLDPRLCMGICTVEGQGTIVWSTHTYHTESESETTDLIIGTSTRDMEMVVDHVSVQAIQSTSHSDAGESRKHITIHSVFLPHWSTIHFSWHFEDTESPITKYTWALGTVKQGTQLQSFVSVGRHSHGNANGLHLSHNQKLYLTVTATNAAGLTTVSHSDPIIVDFTPPVFKWIHDGENGADIDYQKSRTISVSWMADDEETGVAHCDWAVGTVGGSGNIKQFERVETGQRSASYDLNSDLNMTTLTLFSTVRCSNIAGLTAIGVSDGVTVNSDSQTLPSEVEIMEENSLLYHNQGQCHTDKILRLKWSRQEHLHNVVRIEDAKTVYQESVPSNFEYAKLCGFTFEQLSTYTLGVYPESETGVQGLISTHNLTLHGLPPHIRDAQKLETIRSEKRLKLSWSELFSSPWEDLQFEVKAGTVMGGTDLVEGVYTRNPEIDLLVDKQDGTDIYVSITAIDPCGYSAHYNENLQF